MTNPAYDVPSFNGHDRLIRLHQEITDFLHYQSHVQYTATASLLPHTTTANQRERETIIEFLKEECACIRMLKQLLAAADDNAAELQTFFEDSPVDPDINWERSPGGRCRNGNNRRHRHRNDTSVTLSASRSNCPIGYNPHTNESDYDDNETPDIADLYGDEVYNNID